MKYFLDKSFITNLIALLIIVFGYVCPVQQPLTKSIGFFALSGAITNWLAVYMLFEKVPLLYGSGVIPSRFEEFKISIKRLMMEQFFTVENIEQFIETEEQEGSKVLNLEPILSAVDYNKIYDNLVESIMTSSFGGMLALMGGEQALAPLREPLIDKMRQTLVEMIESKRFKEALRHGLDAHKIGTDITGKVETVIDKRLDELTPQMVKEIVQIIIRRHLGWLVVWGGFFGGLIGAIFSVL
ncbi:MAG: DUF445 domain-containing protein [Gammaproteobacteria bacterium]